MRIKFLALLVLMYLVVLSAVEAGETNYWLNVGIGRSSMGGFAGSANISIQFNKYLVSLRATGNTETTDFLSSGDEFYDIGLLFGIAPLRSEMLVSAAIGIALVGGSRDTGESSWFFGNVGRENIGTNIGLPIEIQIFQRLSSYMGIGAYIYANINNEESFGGIALSLQLGKFQ
jgi:hypothetical protein